MRPALAALLLTACAAQGPDPTPVSREVALMGTRASLTTYAPTRQEALARLDAAIEVLERTEAELSTWQADSAVSALNRSPIGEPLATPGRLCGLLNDLRVLADFTHGAFDPAIGALTDAWDLHGAGRVPSDGELADARARSGIRLWQIDATACTATRLGEVALDVGAFGKGEALDRVIAAGVEGPWLIDLGGQVTVQGAPPGGDRWPVALADPIDRTREALGLEIPAGSLATSAGSERSLDTEAGLVGHILDPRTGEPAAFDGSVTVWHASGLWADALSTALFVMGPDAGLAWAEARGLAVVYLLRDGETLQVRSTGAFRPFIVDQQGGRPALLDP